MREHGDGSPDSNPNLCLVAEEHQVFLVTEVLVVSEPREILTELIGLEYLVVGWGEHYFCNTKVRDYNRLQQT